MFDLPSGQTQKNQQQEQTLGQFWFRQAGEADLGELEWNGAYAHFRRLYREIFENAQRGDALLWLVDLRGTGIIGQLFIQLKSTRAELADGYFRAYLYAFRVKPEYRRQGIGSRLLNHVEIDLLNRGYGLICLNVGRENFQARKLYERVGYRVVAAEAGYWHYVDNLGQKRYIHEPAWRMEKRLA